MAFCPIDVTIEDDRPVAVVGNKAAPIYEGFSCPKGRAIPAGHSAPGRLTHSMIRQPDGSYRPVSSAELIEDIVARLRMILDRHGPRAIATYMGGGSYEHQAVAALLPAFMRAIGSPMMFTAESIDQPGKSIAKALHGVWRGGRTRPETWDAYLLVGGNPVISKQYFGQNPGIQLKRLFKDRAKLIVIDPRRTETARRAHVHLQPYPGEDPTILAGLIHLLITSNRIDRDFVGTNADGFDLLAAAVASFTPDYVAHRAGIAEADLRAAADILGAARVADCGTGTGPNMAPRGSLACYLVACLQTIRGFWAREGDQVVKPPVMRPPQSFVAQPQSPFPAWGFGEKFRVRGLQQSTAGLPLGALPEEILTTGPGQIRALFMHGGGATTWPQQELVRRALENLDLLIVPDVEWSPSARVATHVVAVPTQLEVPVMTHFTEMLANSHHGYGWDEPFAAYAPALLGRPAGSDLIEPWQVYYRAAQALSLDLKIPADVPMGAPERTIPMDAEPTTDAIYEIICEGARIPFSEVARHPHGHVFEEAREYVGPREPGCTDRLDVGNDYMLGELAKVRAEDFAARRGSSTDFPLLLTPRRMQNVTNSGSEHVRALLNRAYNPAFMNPADMASLAIGEGDTVTISSPHGAITAIVEADADVRPGVVSMSHGFGRLPGERSDPRRDGANTNLLLRWDDGYDPYTSMPRMSAVPVRVEKVVAAEEVKVVLEEEPSV
jgi:anaerobic selenocysteine-containing dehydrogenase